MRLLVVALFFLLGAGALLIVTHGGPVTGTSMPSAREAAPDEDLPSVGSPSSAQPPAPNAPQRHRRPAAAPRQANGSAAVSAGVLEVGRSSSAEAPLQSRGSVDRRPTVVGPERDASRPRAHSAIAGTATPGTPPESFEDVEEHAVPLVESGESAAPPEPHVVVDLVGLQGVAAVLVMHQGWIPDAPGIDTAAEAVRLAHADISPNDPHPGLELADALDRLLDLSASALDPGGASLAWDLRREIESGNMNAAREMSIEMVRRY